MKEKRRMTNLLYMRIKQGFSEEEAFKFKFEKVEKAMGEEERKEEGIQTVLKAERP
jgi:hypothetical protein